MNFRYLGMGRCKLLECELSFRILTGGKRALSAFELFFKSASLGERAGAVESQQDTYNSRYQASTVREYRGSKFHWSLVNLTRKTKPPDLPARRGKVSVCLEDDLAAELKDSAGTGCRNNTETRVVRVIAHR